jgi:hypothetical protein
VVGTLESPAAIEILQKQISDIDTGLIRIVKALQEQYGGTGLFPTLAAGFEIRSGRL